MTCLSRSYGMTDNHASGYQDNPSQCRRKQHPSPSVSPISNTERLLRERQHIVLEQSHCDMLNGSWVTRPKLRYACVRLLAGCIILNSDNEEAIMTNTEDSTFTGRGRSQSTKDVEALASSSMTSSTDSGEIISELTISTRTGMLEVDASSTVSGLVLPQRSWASNQGAVSTTSTL
ncbi:hypothetical protein B0O80DRAFT_214114 [Mortierella sp. GBAus27b]|nr:hypothetical protein B0O80DRAFT_214114 [Mortierella sp. GBAus27b]